MSSILGHGLSNDRLVETKQRLKPKRASPIINTSERAILMQHSSKSVPDVDRLYSDVVTWPGDVVFYPHGESGAFLIEKRGVLMASMPMIAALFSTTEHRVRSLLRRSGSNIAGRNEVGSSAIVTRRVGERLVDEAMVFYKFTIILGIAEKLRHGHDFSVFIERHFNMFMINKHWKELKNRFELGDNAESFDLAAKYIAQYDKRMGEAQVRMQSAKCDREQQSIAYEIENLYDDASKFLEISRNQPHGGSNQH